MAAGSQPFENGALAVQGGRIAALGPAAEVAAAFAAKEEIRLPRHALLPGLVNAHGHAAMVLLRGAAEDLPLQAWLQDAIWPLEKAAASEEFVRLGTELALAEMLANGITTFSDMYYFPEQAAQCAARAGMRAQVAFPVIQFPNAWSRDADHGIHRGMALHDEYRDDPLVRIAFGPHAAYSVDRPALEKVLMYSEELGLPVQIHLHENAAEVAEARQRVGCSWVEHLNRLGLLGPSLQAVHMTQLSDAEIALVAERRVQVIHCPHSNLKLACGACPVQRLADAGANIALGTDGAASNNSLDLFAEARLAALLAKHCTGDPTSGAAPDVLRMATLGGATALGLDGEIGSLEPGKLADLTAVHLGGLGFAPVRDPVAALLHGAAGAAVSHVWVAGRCLYREGAFSTLDPADLLARAERWRELRQ